MHALDPAFGAVAVLVGAKFARLLEFDGEDWRSWRFDPVGGCPC